MDRPLSTLLTSSSILSSASLFHFRHLCLIEKSLCSLSTGIFFYQKLLSILRNFYVVKNRFYKPVQQNPLTCLSCCLFPLSLWAQNGLTAHVGRRKLLRKMNKQIKFITFSKIKSLLKYFYNYSTIFKYCFPDPSSTTQTDVWVTYGLQTPDL